MTITIKTVGIAGAGTMGQGIAQVCALNGYTVLLYDVSKPLAEKGLKAIEQVLDNLVNKGKLKLEGKSQALTKILAVEKLNDLRADLIIEAVAENLEVKQQLFKTLDEVNGPAAILTTNTSSIPVTQIASVLENPTRFAGLHFFNPAPVMKLVEVISGTLTSDETVSHLLAFSQSIQKIAVLAKDSPGFIVNRVARHYYVEALKMLEEQVADIKTIDSLMKSSGFKMGPFELMDLIGVDTNFAVTTSIYNAFHQESKFRPSRIQQRKVDAGHHGRKCGKGFYDYGK
ncbi:MAG: 3-hydroxybutyryl-CoA dehydrogenase [Flammeovirgaceae bacterium]|nr:MAG: 3-hydroxybutyryl-CoA dehydrogenase [Flammeovirgaceae bacterium]